MNDNHPNTIPWDHLFPPDRYRPRLALIERGAGSSRELQY
jgi:hypothetical protein